MKRRTAVFLVIIALLAVGAFFFVPTSPAPRATIKLTGQHGLAYKGTIKANGMDLMVAGTLPTDFEVSGSAVECSFQKTQPDGEISISVSVAARDNGFVSAGGVGGSGKSAQPQGGVRALIRKGLFRNKCVITTF